MLLNKSKLEASEGIAVLNLLVERVCLLGALRPVEHVLIKWHLVYLQSTCVLGDHLSYLWNTLVLVR